MRNLDQRTLADRFRGIVLAATCAALLLLSNMIPCSALAESDSDEPQDKILRVNNRTPFIVVLYIQGKRVGWLRPYNTGVLRGLPAGNHKVYAHSRWGSTYWGPKNVRVPGTWTLFR